MYGWARDAMRVILKGCAGEQVGAKSIWTDGNRRKEATCRTNMEGVPSRPVRDARTEGKTRKCCSYATSVVFVAL
jgi:hypothetical protein